MLKINIKYEVKKFNKNISILNKKRKREEKEKEKLKILPKKKNAFDQKSMIDNNKKEPNKKIMKNEKNENLLSKSIILKPKGTLVYELLERWWYALPNWPPDNFDITQKLKENKLRLVKINDWRKEPKYKDNFEKCMELPGFKYVYLNSEGKVLDFRPEEGKPSYNNLMKLSEFKLSEYLVIAYKGQLKELEKRDSILEKDLRNIIKEKLDRAERNLAKFNE